MKQLDKTSLLFEMLLGTDMYNVNRKIEEVKLSDEYVRVSNFIPEYSNTQIGYDIKDRFNQIDIFGVLSMQRILEIEKEIQELDRRIASFPTINPYLSNGYESKYGVKTVGDIGVEIASLGMEIDAFTTAEGVEPTNRAKVLKTKLFNWYKEAKRGIIDMLDNSKLMLSKIRNSKFNITSVNLEHFILVIGLIAMFAMFLIHPSYRNYAFGRVDDVKSIVVTICAYVGLIFTFVSEIIKTSYKVYPYRVASKLRKQILSQANIVTELDEVSYEYEKKIINRTKKPHKVDVFVKDLAIVNKPAMSNSDLFDYVYSEKEYYIAHHKGLLRVHNVIFIIALIAIVVASFALIVIK